MGAENIVATEMAEDLVATEIGQAYVNKHWKEFRHGI